MQMRKFSVLTSFLAILGLVVTSCAPVAAPSPTPKPTAAPAKVETPAAKPPVAPAAPSPSPKAAAEQPKYGGILTIARDYDPPHFDPHQESTRAIPEAIGAAYSGLFQFDPLDNDKIITDLVQSWEAGLDGRSYTFRLHKGVSWHDGKPFSSADAKFSLERIASPPKGMVSPRQATLAGIGAIETPDTDTLQVTLKRVQAGFVAQLALGHNLMLPIHVAEARGDMKREVVGTGPYRFKNYQAGISCSLLKNTAYFIKGRPYLDGVTSFIIKDYATQFAALRTKQVHMAVLRATAAETAKKEMPNIVVQTSKPMLGDSLTLNVQKRPFNDPRVRKAISLSIDRQSYIRSVRQGMATLAAPMPPGSWAIPADELANLPGYRQPKDADVAEARRLLAEAGFPEGFETKILTRSSQDYVKSAEFLNAALAKLQIKTALEIHETATYHDLRRRGLHSAMAQRYVINVNDPDDLVRHFQTASEENYSKWSDEKVDELIAKVSMSMDPVERKTFALELQRRILESATMILISWDQSQTGAWSEVRNYKPGVGLHNNLKYQDVWLAKQ